MWGQDTHAGFQLGYRLKVTRRPGDGRIKLRWILGKEDLVMEGRCDLFKVFSNGDVELMISAT
jgi:hypothetical protein